MDEYLLDANQKSDVSALLDVMNAMESTFASQIFSGPDVNPHVAEIASHLIDNIHETQDICRAALDATKSDFE